MSFSDPNSFESKVRAELKRVKQAIANATSPWSTPYRMKETEELQKFLNTHLKALGVFIEVDGVYGPAICEAITKLFPRDLHVAQELKREAGNHCEFARSGNLKDIPRRGNMKFASTSADTQDSYKEDQEQLILVEDEYTSPVNAPRNPNTFCPLPHNVCYSTPKLGAARRASLKTACDRALNYYKPPPQVKGINGLQEGCELTPKTIDGVITSANTNAFLFMYGACNLSKVPDCNFNVDTFAEPTPDDEDDDKKLEEDNNQKYMIGGLLGLLVVGGIIYTVSKKKKKGRK